MQFHLQLSFNIIGCITFDPALVYRFDLCIRRNGNPKTMTSSFSVQTVFTTASKHYKFAVNLFYKRVLVIPNVTETLYYPRRVRHSKRGHQTSLHLVFKL